MCNRFTQAGESNAVHRFLDALDQPFSDDTPWIPGDIYPDQDAQIITAHGHELQIQTARWGFPEIKPGAGVITNIRNLASPWWRQVNRPYLEDPEFRCLVPFSAFAEPPRNPTWFQAHTPTFFAGVWRPWSGPRLKPVPGKKRRQRIDDDWTLFSFLTCAPNAEVARIHPKAMPVILTTPQQCHQWLAGGTDSLHHLQRPLPDGALNTHSDN